MHNALKTKLLIGALAVLTTIGGLLVHLLHVNHQTAVDVHKLADERRTAEQIDKDDKAAIQKIRERNAQKAAGTPQQ